MRLNLLHLFQPTNSNKPLGGRYKIISQLGAGGFGQTFLAEDLHLPGHPQCVVKQLKPQVADEKSLQTARRLFDVEAKVLYQLGNHDQIPRLLAHFEDNQEFYLAQELIEGEALTKELAEGRVWLESEVIALLQDILHVLAFVHQEQVIHRDIKPSNLIRRRQDGRIVLIDFGAVKEASTQVSSAKTSNTKTISIGTQGYTPKEQLGGNPRFSSDVYAVGMLGIQALTGVHPRRLTEDSQTGEIVWRDHVRHVSSELAGILECMVRYDFRDRYPTAMEALEAVRSLSTLRSESQLAPDPTSEFMEEPTQQAPQPPLSPTGATGSETDSSSTKIWEPAQPAVASQLGSSTSSTPSPSQSKPLVHSSPSSAPTVARPEAAPKRFVNPWLVLPLLAVTGATVFMAKPLLFPQTTGEIATQGEPPESRNTRSIDESTPSSSSNPATENPSPSSTETSASPSPGSPDAKSSNAISTETPASPSPESSSPATKPSPNPAKSVAKPSPSPAAPAAKPSPSPAAPVAKPSPSPASQPDDAKANWDRCYNLNLQQQYADAIAACDKALAINPNYAEAFWSKGYALDQLKRHQDALQQYERATEVKPDFAEAWSNRGGALLLLNRPKEAVAAFDKATALKSDFAAAWRDRGAALIDLERYDEAIESLEKAIALQPNDDYAINLLMTARLRQGR